MLDRRTVVIGLTAVSAASDAMSPGHVSPQRLTRGGEGPENEPLESRSVYQSRDAMAERVTPMLADCVYLAETGREGSFVVDHASNWRVAIVADTARGVLVPSVGDPTKVYVRADIWRHFWDIRWFGALGDDQNASGPDCIRAIDAFLVTAAAVGKLRTNDATFNGLIGCDFPGYFYCSKLINLKTPVHLRGLSGGMGGVIGGSRLRFPAGVAGIVINGADTDGYTRGPSVPTTGADGSILDGLSLWCGDGQRPEGGGTHGILVRARCTIQNCWVTGFAGSGIAVHADVGGSNPMYGNADGTHIRGGRTQNNGVHGLHLKGDNANACEIVGLDTFGNGQWGKLDESFLANTFIAGQDAANGLSSYVCHPARGQVYACRYGQERAASTTEPGTNALVWYAIPSAAGGFPQWVSGGTYYSAGSFACSSGSTFLHPYVEGAQGAAQPSSSAIVIGGLLGAAGEDLIGPRIKAFFGQIMLEGGFVSDMRSWMRSELVFDGNYSTDFPGSLGKNFGGGFYWNGSDGLVGCGYGSVYDFNVVNKSGQRVLSVPTGTRDVTFGGNLSLASGKGLHINGHQVVGPRQAAIARPNGGATVDAEARGAIDAIRAVLTAHGLTA